MGSVPIYLIFGQHNTMESLLERGEKLDDLVSKSEVLGAQSKAFYKTVSVPCQPGGDTLSLRSTGAGEPLGYGILWLWMGGGDPNPTVGGG